MAKTSLKTHAVLKFIALNPWRSICQMLANFSGVEFYRTVSNLKKKNRCLVFTSSGEREIRLVSRRGRATTANNEQKKRPRAKFCFANLNLLLLIRKLPNGKE